MWWLQRLSTASRSCEKFFIPKPHAKFWGKCQAKLAYFGPDDVFRIFFSIFKGPLQCFFEQNQWQLNASWNGETALAMLSCGSAFLGVQSLGYRDTYEIYTNKPLSYKPCSYLVHRSSRCPEYTAFRHRGLRPQDKPHIFSTASNGSNHSMDFKRSLPSWPPMT